MSTHVPAATPAAGGPTRAALIMIIGVAVMVVVVAVVVRSTSASMYTWRAGYGDPPGDVRTRAIGVARTAAGWTRRQVPDKAVGAMLVRACTDMHQGQTTRQRDTAALTYLARRSDSPPLKALAEVPEAVAAGVAVQCPDA